MSLYEILLKYKSELWNGLWVTLQLCAFVYPIGIVFGVISGTARHKWKSSVGLIGTALTLIISCTPILVFLFWAHYPLQYMLQIVVDPFITSTIVLSVIMSAIISDQTVNALSEFPNQFILSAKACGLSHYQIVRRIQLPIIIKTMIPNILFSMITVLQASLFTSMIGVNELFRTAQRINSDIYKPVEIYTALAIFFLAVCICLTILAKWLRRKISWTISQV